MFPKNFFPIIATGVIVFHLSACQSNPKPTAVVEEYFHAFQTMDIDTLYELFSESYQVEIGGKPGLKMVLGMMSGFSMIQGDSINNYQIVEIKQEKIDRKTVKIIALLQRKQGQTDNASLILIKEKDGWKINEIIEEDAETASSISAKSQKSYSVLEKVFTNFNFGSQELFPIYENDKKGYIDSKGNVVISPQFDFSVSVMDFAPPDNYVYELSENSSEKETKNLFVVRIGDSSGYVNKQGKYVINPQFSYALPFSEGLAAVKDGNKWGFINTKGESVIESKFDWVDSFSEGLAQAGQNGQYGYINQQGEFVIKPQFALPLGDGDAFDVPFSEGLAPVFINEQTGYINQQGKYVIKPQFKYAYSFAEGLALVNNGDRWGFINTKGKSVIEPQFDLANSFSEELAAVNIGFNNASNESGKWGYINKQGKYVINPQFEKASDFIGGLAAVKINNKWGYINKQGKYVINPQFEDAGDFVGELAAVGVLSEYQGSGWKIKYGYINKKGEFVWRGEFTTKY
jgi:hypothetical protein